MVLPRIIPCLLVHNKGLVKTVRFKEPKYVGDPLNAVKIFNEKEADELMVLDIDATVQGKEPSYRMIENLAAECRMPLCYGGGITNAEQASRIFSLGVEKIAISSALIANPNLIEDISSKVGAQSVVAVLDIKKNIFGKYSIYTHNGTRKVDLDLFDMVQRLKSSGVGEIVINSIDHDGMMKGYDFDLVEKIKANLSVPLTVLGGAGSLDDIAKLVVKYPIIGAAAGSLFVFKGKYKAVLISYPNHSEKQSLVKHLSYDD